MEDQCFPGGCSNQYKNLRTGDTTIYGGLTYFTAIKKSQPSAVKKLSKKSTGLRFEAMEQESQDFSQI